MSATTIGHVVLICEGEIHDNETDLSFEQTHELWSGEARGGGGLPIGRDWGCTWGARW